MADLPKIEAAVRSILEAIGEDPDRDGLKDTPTRVAKLSLIHISEPTRLSLVSRMPSSA